MSVSQTTTYTTTINGAILYSGESKEQAIRTWDSRSVYDGNLEGGIQVQTFDGEYMVRDGWILHVSRGHVYLHPCP